MVNYYINKCWLWFCKLKDYEPINGVTQIVKLLPDKLATTTAITKEEIQDPEDDKPFLVNLVLSLVKVYHDNILKSEKKNFKSLSDELRSVKHKLRTRKVKKQKKDVQVLSQLIQDQVRIFPLFHSKNYSSSDPKSVL